MEKTLNVTENNIYKYLLLLDEWKEFRNKVIEYNKSKNNGVLRCDHCNTPLPENMCEIHHPYYNGNKPWEYPVEDMVVLCKIHHAQRHLDKQGALEKASKLSYYLGETYYTEAQNCDLCHGERPYRVLHIWIQGIGVVNCGSSCAKKFDGIALPKLQNMDIYKQHQEKFKEWQKENQNYKYFAHDWKNDNELWYKKYKGLFFCVRCLNGKYIAEVSYVIIEGSILQTKRQVGKSYNSLEDAQMALYKIASDSEIKKFKDKYKAL